LELEQYQLLCGPQQYYVKMGRDCQQNAMNCIKGGGDKSVRIRRRISSDGRKRKVFVDTLLELIASEWDDEKMEAWLTLDAEEVQQSNKKGESDNSTRTASSPKAADESTDTASPPKDDSNSTTITPNELKLKRMYSILLVLTRLLITVELSLGMQFVGLWSTRKA
jgi:DNA-directed RNA polymerase specialized sigma subunit